MQDAHLYLSPSQLLPTEETIIVENYVDEDEPSLVVPLCIIQGSSVVWLDEDQIAKLKAFL